MISGRGDFFDGYHVVSDFIRLSLIAAGMFLAMVVFRVAWVRWRTHRALRDDDTSWLGMASYAVFVLIPVFYGLRRFGDPIDVPVVVLNLTGLTFGVAGAFQQVSLKQWGRARRRERE